MNFGLRGYQQDLKDAIRGLFVKGVKRVVLCAPTGSGKTVTFADIARSTILAGRRVIVVVDRKELLDQAVKKLREYGLNPQIIQGQRPVRPGQNCYVATIQTLIKRTPPEVDLIIIDEAHKQTFDKILDLDAFKSTFVIGATATPIRTGNMNQLSDYYQEMVQSVSIQDLIELGFLTPAISFGAAFDTSKIKMKGKDFDIKSMFDAFNKVSLYSGVVKKYEQFAPGSKAIVFNVNVEHSKKVCESFVLSGYNAMHLDGNTPKRERAYILEWFSKTPGAILNNCDILTTGFDEWSIETVILNRSTKSKPLFFQMCGRGSRIVPQGVKAVKDFFTIIDMGSNIVEHGFWEQDQEFSLTHKKKEEKGVAPIKECPESENDIKGNPGCGCFNHAAAPTCKHCGFIFPEKKKEEPKEIEFVQLENYQLLPAHLVGKQWGSMTIQELEEVRIAKKMKGQGWIVRQILLNKDLKLIEYARMKKYKYPQAWVSKMEKIYLGK
ncbi:DNA helicase [Cellulophaga phage phi18:1]|uniref:Helicase n=1 Tax=Cellulophaga phage phi18:1 TaxID=1327982 RepID=R9ZYM9_9CAUD|nr:DNA helicase [Cellulophaga phage phi18:1]AGO48459.1 helicase [Cellulophaga phage phi18:1]